MGQPTANQHRAGKKIAAQLAEHGVHESAYQVAKNLDTAKAWERGELTLAQLCDTAGFDMPQQEQDNEVEEEPTEDTDTTAYTYRLEARTGEDLWDLVDDGATTGHAGNADELARDTLHTWMGRMISEDRLGTEIYGRYRVRVWADGNGGDPDGEASTWISRRPNRGGRPREGQAVNVRLPEDLITALDECAKSAGESRAETIRRRLSDSLA